MLDKSRDITLKPTSLEVGCMFTPFAVRLGESCIKARRCKTFKIILVAVTFPYMSALEEEGASSARLHQVRFIFHKTRATWESGTKAPHTTLVWWEQALSLSSILGYSYSN